MSWLKHFLDTSGISGNALAKRAGTSRQQISKLVHEQRGLSKDWAERLAPCFSPELHVNPRDLMFGPEDGGHVASEQIANGDYHVEPDFPPDPDQAKAARKKARRQLEPGELVEVDVIGGLGPGGFAPEIVIDGQVVDNLRATWRVPQDFLHSELRAREIDVEIFPVEGDSMIPTLTAGDRVLINRRQNTLSQDGLYAITGPTGVQVKRLQYIQGTEDPVMVEVISDNPMHSNRPLPLEQVRIIGRVICRISRL
ncbi:S24 family peptidase [Xanthobacter flavus]|uniref:S24 family peptidase n=1 Tax=Xanthobacter flavus TaxID=281 RepID=UPI003729D21D